MEDELSIWLVSFFISFFHSIMEKYFPNLQEVLYYDAIYSLALKEGNGSFCGKGAVSFFKKCNLSMEEIKTVW